MAKEPTEASKVGICGLIMGFTGRTRTVTPPGKTLGVILEGASPAEQVGRTGITE